MLFIGRYRIPCPPQYLRFALAHCPNYTDFCDMSVYEMFPPEIACHEVRRSHRFRIWPRERYLEMLDKSTKARFLRTINRNEDLEIRVFHNDGRSPKEDREAVDHLFWSYLRKWEKDPEGQVKFRMVEALTSLWHDRFVVQGWLNGQLMFHNISLVQDGVELIDYACYRQLDDASNKRGLGIFAILSNIDMAFRHEVAEFYDLGVGPENGYKIQFLPVLIS